MRKGTLSLCCLLLVAGCHADRAPRAPTAREVVVYTSLDRPYAEPVLNAFTRQTGIAVRAVYDTEAAKSLGLARRIVAERRRPRADVFWSSEIVRLVQLKAEGVLAPYRSPQAEGIPERFRDRDGFWTGFAARARVLIWNRDQVRDPPGSLLELADPKWRGEVVMANPLFGTTASEAAALFQVLGRERAEAHFRALKANGVRIVDGNAVVADWVGRGEAKVGVTDTDDAYSRIRDGKPLGMRFPDQEGIGTLVIPNTVALVRDGPNPDGARRLIDYLVSPEVEAMLARGGARQLPLRDGVAGHPEAPSLKSLRAMDLDFERLAGAMDDVDRFLRTTFLR